MTELDRQAKATSNGPVALQTLSNGPNDDIPLDEKEIKEVAILEKKLEELKSRNDVSYTAQVYHEGRWSLLYVM